MQRSSGPRKSIRTWGPGTTYRHASILLLTGNDAAREYNLSLCLSNHKKRFFNGRLIGSIGCFYFFRYAGRPASAATATGNKFTHLTELDNLLREACNLD